MAVNLNKNIVEVNLPLNNTDKEILSIVMGNQQERKLSGDLCTPVGANMVSEFGHMCFMLGKYYPEADMEAVPGFIVTALHVMDTIENSHSGKLFFFSTMFKSFRGEKVIIDMENYPAYQVNATLTKVDYNYTLQGDFIKDDVERLHNWKNAEDEWKQVYNFLEYLWKHYKSADNTYVSLSTPPSELDTCLEDDEIIYDDEWQDDEQDEQWEDGEWL